MLVACEVSFPTQNFITNQPSEDKHSTQIIEMSNFLKQEKPTVLQYEPHFANVLVAPCGCSFAFLFCACFKRVLDTWATIARLNFLDGLERGG